VRSGKTIVVNTNSLTQKKTIPGRKKKVFGHLVGFLKNNIFFIFNSAQDFSSCLSLTATVQKLEICPLRILIICYDSKHIP
jgi:hypothetical protein